MNNAIRLDTHLLEFPYDVRDLDDKLKELITICKLSGHEVNYRSIEITDTHSIYSLEIYIEGHIFSSFINFEVRNAMGKKCVKIVEVLIGIELMSMVRSNLTDYRGVNSKMIIERISKLIEKV